MGIFGYVLHHTSDLIFFITIGQCIAHYRTGILEKFSRSFFCNHHRIGFVKAGGTVASGELKIKDGQKCTVYQGGVV